MSKALSLLQIAQALLSGGTIAKADPGVEPDPDAIQGHDHRAEGGSPTEEQLEAARAESQAGQQAAAAQGGEPGAGGEGEGDGEGGEGGAGSSDDEGGGQGPGDGSDDDGGGQVSKAEILGSITFLATHHGISGEEVAKALGFSGGEGDPTAGKAPVGQGVELLERLVQGQDNQNKVLDAIASFLAEMSKRTVALSTEIGKSMEAAEAAKATAETTATALAGIMKAAPAMPAKAQVEVTKSLGGPSGLNGGQNLNASDLFKIALKGEHSPAQIASASRAINYGIPVTL